MRNDKLLIYGDVLSADVVQIRCSLYDTRGRHCDADDEVDSSGLQTHKRNSLMATLKPQSNGPLYSSTIIGTVAVDGWGWAATFGTAQSPPPRCTKCNSPPIDGQCTNFILFDVAL